MYVFFFLQAEDGIRDYKVTGVQTCALPILADPQRLNAVIRHTWPEDMVSVGEHAFLPHFRTEAVRTLATAVGISPTPIHWEKDPNRTARIVIFIVAPLREAALDRKSTRLNSSHLVISYAVFCLK